MSELTKAQVAWLCAHPQYCFPGPPKPGPRFYECGTLYADGRFELMAPMKAVKLEPGCRLVGIPGDLYLTGEPDGSTLSSQQGNTP
jgi:hypothetical protein